MSGELSLLIRYTTPNTSTHCPACVPFASECKGIVPATACVAHRCSEHSDMPVIGNTGPEQSECSICVAQTFVIAYEKSFEAKVFWPAVQSARDRLNLLSPGAGDQFVDETRATLNAAGIETEW